MCNPSNLSDPSRTPDPKNSKSRRSNRLAPLLAILLLPGVLVAAMAPLPTEPESPAYREGREALDDRDWKAAEDAFRRAIELGDDESDAAHYWLAYALAKGGRTADALATLGTLEREWPSSSWRDDAKALRLELQSAGGRVPDEERLDNEELKLMALAGLVRSDPERAMPMVEKILRGAGSQDLKEQALFLAGQMGGQKGRDMIVRVARDNASEDLQEAAIEYLAVLGGDDSLSMLDELFDSVGADARESIIEAYMIAGATDRLLRVAQSDRDPELRAAAVEMLGVQGAVDDLWTIFQSEKDPEVRESVLEGLMISGSAQHLMKVAQDSSDPELQEEALQLLGVMGEHDFLRQVFDEVTSEDLKEEIVEALGIAGRTSDLESIARDRSQPLDVREEAVTALGIHGGGDLLWQLLQEGESELAEEILEGLAIAGESERILEMVHQTSQPMEIREQALESLVIVGVEESALMQLYDALPERPLREGVLELMFISGAAEPLAALARRESDPKLRAQAVEYLGLTGSSLAADVMQEILEETP